MPIERLNSGILFESGHLSKNLTTKTLRGVATTLTAQGIQSGMSIFGTMILARLLTPADYGIIAMASVVTAFLRMFKDAGLGLATIQQQSITREQISTLFWINCIISAGLALVVLASAPLVGMFYGRSELVPVMAMLSVNFFLGGLTLQHNALLRRHMMFRAQRSILILSQVAGILTSVPLAYLGFSYWALVWGTLVNSLVVITLTWYYCNWIPGPMSRGSGIRKMLIFGGHITGFHFANFFARNGDNLLIGKFLGAEALGIYSKAYSLFMLPVSQFRAPLTQVLMPALSSIKSDPERFERNYYRIDRAIVTLAMPVAAYCLIEAEFIVSILLGAQWGAVVPVLRVLAACGFAHAAATTRGLYLLTHGYSAKFLRLGIASSILTLTSFVIGLRWGIMGVATAYTIYSYLFFIPSVLYTYHNTPMKISRFFAALGYPVLNTMLCIFIVTVTKRLSGIDSHWVDAALTLVYFAAYLGLSMLQKSFRELLKLVLTHLRTDGAGRLGSNRARTGEKSI